MSAFHQTLLITDDTNNGYVISCDNPILPAHIICRVLFLSSKITCSVHSLIMFWTGLIIVIQSPRETLCKNVAMFNTNYIFEKSCWNMRFSQQWVWRWLSSGMLHCVVCLHHEVNESSWWRGSKLLWNVDRYLTDYTVLDPRKSSLKELLITR
jgi:hypothetical protein